MRTLVPSPHNSWRFYESEANRARAEKQLRKHWNYVHMWKDTRGYALSFANVDWKAPARDFRPCANPVCRVCRPNAK